MANKTQRWATPYITAAHRRGCTPHRRGQECALLLAVRLDLIVAGEDGSVARPRVLSRAQAIAAANGDCRARGALTRAGGRGRWAVACQNAHVGHLAIADVKDLGNVVVKRAAQPLGAVGNKHHDVVIAGKDIVQLRLKCAPRKLEDFAEYRKHLSYALVVAREWFWPGKCQRVSSAKNCPTASMSPRANAANPSRASASSGCAT